MKAFYQGAFVAASFMIPVHALLFRELPLALGAYGALAFAGWSVLTIADAIKERNR